MLAGWNGLAAGALARAGALLDEPDWVAAAAAALDFVQAALVDRQGRLRRSWRHGAAAVPGFAEDYALLTWGLTELYQARHAVADLAQSLRWQEEMRRLFADGDGDLWECGADAEAVLGRGRATMDGAMPAAGSIVALNLLRLADLTGNRPVRRRRAAAAPAPRLGSAIIRSPCPAADRPRLCPRPAPASGGRRSGSSQQQADGFLAADQGAVPAAHGHPGAQPDDRHSRPALAPDRRPPGQRRPAIAYLCSGQSCQLPAVTPGELRQATRRRRRRHHPGSSP